METPPRLDHNLDRRAARYVLAVLLPLVLSLLAFALHGCAAIGAAIGGTAGAFIAGPAGAVGGGALGAEAGDVFAQKKRAEEDAAAARLELARERDETASLRATLIADTQIAEHNAALAPGEKPTPLLGPPAPVSHAPPKSFWSRTILDFFTGRGK